MTRKLKSGHFAGLPPAECRIYSRPWTRGSAACHRPSLLVDFLAFLGSHGHMIGSKILAMQHLKELHPQIGTWWICSHLLRWSRFCSSGEGFVATFQLCVWGGDGSGHAVFLRALTGQGCFQSPGTSSRSSTPLNGSYPAVLQFQHYFFSLLWSLITAFLSTAIVILFFENFGIPSLQVEIVSLQWFSFYEKWQL